MLINHKIFNLPPYISTSWNNVQGLHMRGNVLVVTLLAGENVEISDLSEELLKKIFLAHLAYLENTGDPRSTPNVTENPSNTNFDPNTVFQFGQSMDGLGTAMQHNPALSNIPDLPSEFLEKIGAIANIVAPEEISALPKPENHCNCPHCQIARAITGNIEVQIIHPEHEHHDHEEPIVSAEELHFQQWKIEQTGDQLFEVTNKLEPTEKYHVFLGNPIGCTCGEPGCVHIPAVLKLRTLFKILDRRF